MRQWLLNRSARWFGRVDCLHAWTQARLEQDGFIDRHPELFPNSTGFGWYAWKPYIILRALQDADEGDLVIYQDTGRREPVLISRSLREWDAYLAERGLPGVAGVRIPDWGPNRLWTKQSAFRTLGLQGPRYEDAPQIQASWSVWRKSAQTEAFVGEWAELCQRLDLVGGPLENGPEGEVSGFHEHRWDQSLLTLLALRDGLPTLTPAERRESCLNEKCVDSFGNIPNAVRGFRPFSALVLSYHMVESALKSSGLFQARKPSARN